MKYKGKLYFLLILLFLSITVVSAADLNDLAVDGPLIVDEENYLQIDESSIVDEEDSEIDENSISQNNDDGKLLADDPEPGTFDDLQIEINEAPVGSTLDLYRDYTGHYGSRIQFNKNLTIDGHGHKLDCLNQDGCFAFYSSSGSIVLKNLIICNGNNDFTKNGGAISIVGSAKYTIINCTFRDNVATENGGAIYCEVSDSLVVWNSTFINNNVKERDGGAIFFFEKISIYGSYFASNYAKKNGGAICGKKTQYGSNIFIGG